MLEYFALAENESIGRIQYNLLQVRICPHFIKINGYWPSTFKLENVTTLRSASPSWWRKYLILTAFWTNKPFWPLLTPSYVGSRKGWNLFLFFSSKMEEHLVYEPIKAGSIDGTDVTPHDHAIVRALQADCKCGNQTFFAVNCICRWSISGSLHHGEASQNSIHWSLELRHYRGNAEKYVRQVWQD